MTKADIQLLFEYDRWANHKVLEAASALSPEQFTRNLGGSFPSLRDTLVHILMGEWNWLTYWGAPDDSPEFLASFRARREAMFCSEAFPDVAAVRSKWKEIEVQQVEFVKAITEAALAKRIPARGTRIALVHLMQHLANHSTYHRGQAALMMRQLGVQPPVTDFHVFVAEKA
jgi:uncharacterized damage-inducible protein DinB